VNENQTSGVGKQVKGAVKEVTSKVTGNTLGEVEGNLEKNLGKAQTKIGNEQEKMRKSEQEDKRP